ncbi:radical SAM family heme chaperone HemW [Megalodesulfovibrio gigas]|uniref:Heme chaperone HemW n=1 Tax=Megalodesulfovibrio gigas (strain ATCC 19364 / DSM 1382 / NCIMB 9332 / VKM B-1759) TaxID=1121448 RepID=T2GEC1_MEGG1|nr:radical SAM family heme chaperone HemW [Megalodesulfovibrio gigas]AGW14608.1 putative oxygen-independent coproporphyrinogen III oxidase [Megalodesulfovibrio gigas DSM 1382 = ATCC 19364]
MLCYIHVPFCTRKCAYCAFASQVPRAGDMQAYVDALLQEIAIQGDRLGRRTISTLYFGGGTPSLLPAKVVEVVFRRLRRAFRIAPDAEITLEANPESVTAHHLHDLVSLGVNRVSIGLQAMDDESLGLLGRCHTARQGLAAAHNARMAGVQNLSLDLIWGRPGQRLKTWLDELRQVVSLRPEHLSCYSLTVEPGTPLETLCLARTLALPDEEEQGKMFVYGSEYLEGEGYLHYEISNFARLGFQSRHNTGYWEGRDYLGLGPSAVSTLEGRRWANPETLAAWVEAVRTDTLGQDAEPLTLEQRLTELVMLRLRTSRGLNLRGYRRLAGVSFTQQHAAKIQALSRRELIRIHGGYLRLSREGWLVADAILTNLITDG